MRVLIADDEPPARSRLRKVLLPFEALEVIGEAKDGVEALAMIVDQRPDLVFLDVQMPGLDGFEVLRSLPADMAWPLVIFATAFDQYALAAFEANAVGYLLKPIDRDKLSQAIDRAVRLAAAPEQADEERAKLTALTEATKTILTQVVARLRNRMLLIPVEEALYFQIEDGLVKVRTVNALIRTDYALNDLDSRLPEVMFFRAHRSAIVNLRQVREVLPTANSTLTLVMADETQVAVSERQTPALRKRLTL